MYSARRAIAGPAITFSLTAASRKPAGAMIRSRCRQVLVGRDPAQAAEVVDVAVGVDHRLDRALAQVLGDQGERGPRGLRRGERVDHDPAGLAGHEGDVGDVGAADLVDAVGHLEQAVPRR